jgi:hypothetical protein
MPASVFDLQDGDENELREALRKIEVANTAISKRIDSPVADAFTPDRAE